MFSSASDSPPTPQSQCAPSRRSFTLLGVRRNTSYVRTSSRCLPIPCVVGTICTATVKPQSQHIPGLRPTKPKLRKPRVVLKPPHHPRGEAVRTRSTSTWPPTSAQAQAPSLLRRGPSPYVDARGTSESESDKRGPASRPRHDLATSPPAPGEISINAAVARPQLHVYARCVSCSPSAPRSRPLMIIRAPEVV